MSKKKSWRQVVDQYSWPKGTEKFSTPWGTTEQSINSREYGDLVVREDTRATVRPIPTESAPLLGRKQPPADNQANRRAL